MAFAADPSAFPPLRGQHIRMPVVRVAPPQVRVHLPRERGVVGWSELAIVNCRNGPNCASIGLAHEALVGVRHNSTLCRAAHDRIAGVVLADRLSQMM
jgi:hypothetical protein